MPGIRLHHRDKRDCIVQIPRPAQLRGKPIAPNNIRLDGNGDCIVSPAVFAELTEAFTMLHMPSVFLMLGEVNDPPALVIGGSPARERRVFHLHEGELLEQTPTREALHVTGSRTG